MLKKLIIVSGSTRAAGMGLMDSFMSRAALTVEIGIILK
jgi:hypothetical protein